MSAQPIPHPTVPIEFVPAMTGNLLQIGPVTMRILEDGSHTDNRIGSATSIIPPHTKGTPPHYHIMHDETFLVTRGTVRFNCSGRAPIDAHTGDYIVVPLNAPHSFDNVGEEEAEMFSTFTPSFYVNYFKLLAHWAASGQKPDVPMVRQAMANFATMPAEVEVEVVEKA